jgi:hypothetical protein
MDDMTTSTTRAVPVAGTPFALVPLPVLWDEGSVIMVGDHDAGESFCFDHGLGRTSDYDFYLGDRGDYCADPLPVLDGCERAVAWGLTAPGGKSVEDAGGRVRVWTPLLWRLEDGEWLARQLAAACPIPWRIDSDRLLLPRPVAEWLDLVVPVVNRGLPRELLVGCRAYTEATSDPEGTRFI